MQKESHSRNMLYILLYIDRGNMPCMRKESKLGCNSFRPSHLLWCHEFTLSRQEDANLLLPSTGCGHLEELHIKTLTILELETDT